jgi:P4 family phage/plasmid primase-like protien
MSTAKPNEAAATAHLELLGHSTTNLRTIFTGGRVANDYFPDAQSAGEFAAGQSADPNSSGVYYACNRIDPELKDRRDNGGPKASQIVRLVTLPLDIDPNRNHPDGGKVCSSDTEHDAALALADKIQAELTKRGWPQPINLDTGNGARLDYRIDLAHTRTNVAIVNATLEKLAAEFDTPAATVDTSVGDAPRVLRIAGSVNRKSPHTEERPNRVCRIRSTPDKLEPISETQLREYTGPIAELPELSHPTVSDDKFHAKRVELFIAYLDFCKHEHKAHDDTDPRCTKIPVDCFKSHTARTDGRAAIIIWKDGPIVFKCFHEKCKQTFADFEKKLGIAFADFIGQKTAAKITGQTDRYINDPILLAEHHLEKLTAPDGARSYACILGEAHRHDDRDGWLLTKPKDICPFVRATVQNTYDAYAIEQSKMIGTQIKPDPVRGELVHDVIRAMDSICRHDISVTAQPPLWLTPNESDPLDLLVLRNGNLNIRHFVEGREHFTPRTSRLFYQHVANFDYSPTAPRPVVWHLFLESLERPQEWYDALQEFIGYWLWPAFDLQKYWELVGPPRSGKGTICNVVRDLLGGINAVCAPSLGDFATPFGLQQAIGKRLAIVPEVRLPDDPHEIVSRIKAITGGDLITVNRKHLANLPVRLRLKIILQSNNFTPLPDNSGALQSRLIPLIFTKSFVGKEDRKLAQKLIPEYPSILYWALQGACRLWQRGSFQLPADSIEQLEQIRAESAPLQCFIEQVCELNTKKGCQSPALYEIYKAWNCKEHPGTEPLSDSAFAQELRNATPLIKKSRAGKTNEREHKGRMVVETAHDNKESRAWLWLGIAPKSEWTTLALAA